MRLLLLLLLQTQDPREAAADSFLKFGQLCVAQKAYADARVAFDTALSFADRESIRDEIKKVQGQLDAFTPDGLKKVASERAKTHAALEKIGFRWYPPHCRWVAKADIAKLDAEQEFIDGEWRDKDAVAALNKKHGTWDDPWVLSDGLHEVHTTVTYRFALRLMNYTTAFRSLLLSRFPDWDLRAPTAGKLGIYLTETQREFREQGRKVTNGGFDPASVRAAAYYLHSNKSLEPCLLTLEPMGLDGNLKNATEEYLLYVFRHELAHQIFYEYSKYDSDTSRAAKGCVWAYEGIAEFMTAFELENATWRLAHREKYVLGDLTQSGAFAWMKANSGKAPTINELARLSREAMRTRENYNTAATFVYFLLYGTNGKGRAPLLKVLGITHKDRDTETTFDEAFKGMDRAALQQQFVRFAKGLKIE